METRQEVDLTSNLKTFLEFHADTRNLYIVVSLTLHGYFGRNVMIFLLEINQAVLEVQLLAAAAAFCTYK